MIVLLVPLKQPGKGTLKKHPIGVFFVDATLFQVGKKETSPSEMGTMLWMDEIMHHFEGLVETIVCIYTGIESDTRVSERRNHPAWP